MPGPRPPEAPDPTPADAEHHRGWINGVVRTFLHGNLSVILLILSVALGAVALLVTPREEDPQIVVPLADVFVSAPGLTAPEVEQQVTTPLERVLYQIDGVEHVYSMSRPDGAIVTVRFFVGQDRERALIRLFKKLEESRDLVPPHVLRGGGWIIKPVEIDDVPIVTLTLRAARDADVDEYALRRVGEELAQRLAGVSDTSRIAVHGGLSRVVRVEFDREALRSRRLGLLEVKAALEAANVLLPAGMWQRDDAGVEARVGSALRDAREVGQVVVGVFDDRPVQLSDVARVLDGPQERVSYTRHGWGPARGFEHHEDAAGTLAYPAGGPHADASGSAPSPAVTIAVSKKRNTNAVKVAAAVIAAAKAVAPQVVPAGMELAVTRNSGRTADEKVNELVESLWVAIVIVIGLLTVGLGWREALVVAVAVPVVFGLTLAVNLLAGYTINRVTLFALILSLGLLVDDPIVDVENIARHFGLRRKATRELTLAAVSEIRPPLISATLAVIASFLPLFFITGMMGPYMRPMALNVPVTMLMSMAVAFTITPWLAYHVLKRRDWGRGGHAEDEFAAARSSVQYRVLGPMLRVLLTRPVVGRVFLGAVILLTVGAALLAAERQVPLKMLPFDNKAELLLVLNMDEGVSLERTDATVRMLESRLARIAEVTDFSAYVGEPSPIDFNGLVRHYYLRHGPHYAEIRVNLVGKKARADASHTLALRVRDELTAVAAASGGRLKLVELPPGPPVIDTIAAEVYGGPDTPYADICAAAELVARRLSVEPGAVEVDDTVEAARQEWVFVPDSGKAALSGVTVAEIAQTLRIALAGADAGILHVPSERHALRIILRLPLEQRSGAALLSDLHVRGRGAGGAVLVPLAELGRWETRPAQQTIYHKNMERTAYVFAEVAGRPPADAIVDVLADLTPAVTDDALRAPGGWISAATPRPLSARSHLNPGGGVAWCTAPGTRVVWSGEGEWQITLDVFRDLGLAFAGALVGIYIILVAQTGSFLIPVIVMLSIPLTILGIMPGFWLLGVLAGGQVSAYGDPIFFTATAMIGMIALAGIVTRQSIILVDFIHLALRRGRPLLDAVIESGVVRLRPILLVVLAAMLSAIPITIDPIFSGLAWALIFGLIASTLFTLFVVPLVYYALYRRVPGHGAGASLH